MGGGEGKGLHPGGCQGNADGGGRRAQSRAAGPAAPPRPVPAGLTCAPRWSRNWEPSGTGGAGRRGWGVGVALSNPTCGGAPPGPPPACLPAPGGTHAPHLPHQPPPTTTPALRGPSYLSSTWLLWSSSSNFLYLNSGAPGFCPPVLLLGLSNGQALLPAPTSGCAGRALALGLGLGLRHH